MKNKKTMKTPLISTVIFLVITIVMLVLSFFGYTEIRWLTIALISLCTIIIALRWILFLTDKSGKEETENNEPNEIIQTQEEENENETN